MRQLLLATNNPGKLQELRSLLKDLAGLRLLSPDDAGIQLKVEESGSDYAQNALLKARAFARESGLPALADDSGLEVEALDGAPGLFSARFAPQKGANDADRRSYLLKQLEDKPQPWKARFRSTACLALPSEGWFTVEGDCRGEIIAEERGEKGFGYDAIFLVEGQGKTMAELEMDEKNKLSHRARAIAGIKDLMRFKLGLS